MAIFANNDKQSNGNSGTTIIASGTKIKGEIDIECNLHIDGEFEGIIRSKNSVTIGKSGGVGGEIYADKLVVSGKFTGLSDCDVIEILPQGRIEGKVVTQELVIERKGYFVGESKIKEEVNAKKSLFAKSDKQPKTEQSVDTK